MSVVVAMTGQGVRCLKIICKATATLPTPGLHSAQPSHITHLVENVHKEQKGGW